MGSVDTHPGWKERVNSALRTLSQVLYGATGYEFARHALEMRRQAETLFMLATMGQLVGVPILPPISALRLIPHFMPDIARWKREMASQKEIWEREEFELHGV
ncbi:MAG: hypothetical protein A3F90_02870 [Deltaproteobacteria bacterium RIFCSPLOWO2_12_FULL_60_19]|nr:MAG: hypothetical protein A3F90_02870 [Deltaproteobacteria bacterium RIFCSPLOWO2_12_FULL_60_19]